MTYTKQGPFSTGGPGTAANLTAMDNGIAAALPLDGSSPMTGPITLAAGHQESGTTGWLGNPTAGTLFSGSGTNFKTTLQNLPTSITLTAGAFPTPQNITAVTVDNLSKTGFTLVVENTSPGFARWEGTYTTVGNCLLAVDATAGTFDHHCDECGHVSSAAPLSAAHVRNSAIMQACTYTCPVCGAIEAFNIGLTAADEADASPQGEGEYATTRGAQAAMIRQLLRLLGLPLAD